MLPLRGERKTTRAGVRARRKGKECHAMIRRPDSSRAMDRFSRRRQRHERHWGLSPPGRVFSDESRQDDEMSTLRGCCACVRWGDALHPESLQTRRRTATGPWMYTCILTQMPSSPTSQRSNCTRSRSRAILCICTPERMIDRRTTAVLPHSIAYAGPTCLSSVSSDLDALGLLLCSSHQRCQSTWMRPNPSGSLHEFHVL